MVDFVFLDSKEFDDEHMLNEFKAIQPHLSDKFIVCCDDVLNTSSVKWKKAVPYIKEIIDKSSSGMWFEYTTPTGCYVAVKS